MLNFSKSSSSCCSGTRRYRTSPNSTRIYGPAPSDIRPVLQATSNIVRPVSKSRRWRWSEESRSKLRENYKESAEAHPLYQWRARDPAAFSKMVSEAVTKVREKESQVRLLKFLTGSQPRKLELWNPEGFKPRYRISLFSGRFFFRIPGELPDPGTETADTCHSVLVSVSISPSSPHPCPARRSRWNEHSPLNSIGIKVSGKHPVTGDHFGAWTTVGDGILQRIVDIAHSFEDQAMFREICMKSLEVHEKG